METTAQGNDPTSTPQVITGVNSSEQLATISVSGEPDLGILDRRTVTLKLAVSDSEAKCHFWVGLARKGELSPSSLLDQTNISSVFAEAASKGVSDEGPR